MGASTAILRIEYSLLDYKDGLVRTADNFINKIKEPGGFKKAGLAEILCLFRRSKTTG